MCLIKNVEHDKSLKRPNPYGLDLFLYDISLIKNNKLIFSYNLYMLILENLNHRSNKLLIFFFRVLAILGSNPSTKNLLINPSIKV